MVFRFSEDMDKELMCEVIKQRPFAAKYGETGTVWVQVATRVSASIKVVVIDKQVQDRVRLLKKNWRAGELRATLGSGIEEAKDATDVQSHYNTLAGLVGQYVALETEAITRRALRGEYLLSSDSSSESEDDTSSVASTQSVASQANTTRTVTSTRRKSTYQLEVDRQEKRIRLDTEMRRDRLNESVTKLENVPNFGLHKRANNPKSGTDN
ncbi:hypothetical protein PPTG_03797 [Phytophthora nicotianae INRA-310]|uniref:Uncharacterized protein n=1 Tax=Phytophthora nicotianae (strain INRA-310) TaxID=761204 RepID=W2R0P7_PHYN3|nr:hypothetical protein PPTG_03797 [Phytophthora nicotianae INRA-310]ETN18090.1 hypothetical protein PPTG_03797 [Phytophthora nicotianae INRA-310]